MNAPTKVGAFALGALVLGALLVLRIEDVQLGKDRRAAYQVLFETAQGLEEKADVRLNGVRVGVVGRLELVPEGVRVTAELDRKIPVREGAVASVGTLGLLGEKHLEIRQGPKDAPVLPEGSMLPAEKGAAFEDAIELATELGGDLTAVSKNLKATLGGPEGQERLEAMVQNLVETTSKLSELVATNQGNVDRTMDNFRVFSESMRDFGQRVEELAKSREGQVGESVGNIAELTEKLNVAAENLVEITARVARGDGTLGRLIADEEAAIQVKSAIASLRAGVTNLREVIDAVVDTRLDMGLRTEYLTQRAAVKGYFNLDLVPPKSPRYYRLELVSQPFGLRSVTTTNTTLTPQDGSPPQSVEVREEEFLDTFAISLLVGWRLKPLVLRGGVFENTGGVGLDLVLLKERLRVSADAWDFARDNFNPHLKLSGAFYVLPNLWVMGGWDDFLNSAQDRSSIFVGAGIRWDADDVKYILPWVSVP